MKLRQPVFARLAACILWMVFPSALTCLAATNPALNYPQGLAVDAKGNLYVANNGGNQVLVYKASYEPVPAMTITKNVSQPTAVAFDSSGNLWVADFGTDSITEYGPNGVQKPRGTQTKNVHHPLALAFDALEDLWIQNDYSSLSLCPLDFKPVQTYPTTTQYTGIATHKAFMAMGSNSSVFIAEISPFIFQFPTPVGTLYTQETGYS